MDQKRRMPGGPSRSSDREQAEGSRENVRNSESSGRGRGNSGGISNRPLDREQSEQEELPERDRSDSER